MSALDITILVTGSITFIAAFCAVIWVIYDSIKTVIQESSFVNFLIMVVMNSFLIFAICLTYVKYTEKKDSTEYQQYLDLKSKYEKE